MGILNEKDFIEKIKSLSELSFKPGERSDISKLDSHDNRYIESGDFCANLHIHTEFSDGKMTIPELIEKTEEIPNMLVAITDHDTIEGCKIAKQLCPDNINMVLGVEISTVAINFPKQPKPMPVHLLVYGINPYDEKLNEFLDTKRNLKLKLAKETITKLNKTLPEYNFTLEEAAKCHPMIEKGQDEVAHPLKKYTSGKILLDYYFPNADFSYEKPIYKYKYLFSNPEPYHINYKYALEMYTGVKLPLIPQEIENRINKAREIYLSAHPSIGKMLEPFSSFEDTVKFVSTLQSGVMSIAHPARNRAYTSEFYTYLFNNFKKSGGEKAMFFEKYYQSYEGRYFQEWCPIINAAAENFNLFATGGLDSHGLSITSRCPHY